MLGEIGNRSVIAECRKSKLCWDYYLEIGSVNVIDKLLFVFVSLSVCDKFDAKAEDEA